MKRNFLVVLLILAGAVMGRAQEPGAEIERIEPGQMIPKPQQDLLGGVFGVGGVRQQGAGVTVNLIAMPLTKDFKFKLTNHPVTDITNEGVKLLQTFEPDVEVKEV